MQAKLTIYDVTGKMLKVIEDDYRKGYHEVIIRNEDLIASGVLYYQLSVPGYMAVKRMILIK